MLTVANTLKLRYEPSETNVISRVKSGELRRIYLNSGRRVVGGNFGTYVIATPARFILVVEVNGEQYEIWTERTFKKMLGINRLTIQVREKIEKVMPKSIEVEEVIGQKGTKYYNLSKSAAKKWVSEVLL